MPRFGVGRKKVAGKHIREVRVAGSTIHPDRTEEMILEPVRPAKGFGRWIYCKYCYKNVKPMLSGINQIVCSQCGSGLTPDFFSIDNLRRWLAGDDSALEKDRNSNEAKVWLEKAKKGKNTTWKLIRRTRI